MKRDARVVAEMPGRQGKVNSANIIGHAVRVFVLCEAAMISVPAVRAQIRLVAHRQPKLGILFIAFVWGKLTELVNAKISCKCKNKLHLPLRKVVFVFSVQSEGKFVSVLDGLSNFYDVISCHFPS